MKRFGQPPKPGQSYKRRPGVYAILPRDGCILATFQGGMHQECQLPGGGVDPGESPIPALYREVMEETGWQIAEPKVFSRFKRFTYMPEYNMWAEKICTLYVARPIRQISAPTEADHTPIWLDYDTALSSLAVSGDRDALAQFVLFG